METALHVGTGQTSATTDAGVLRDFHGRPLIPGSSLKGALRSAVERRANWLGLQSCGLEKGYSGCLTTNRRAESIVDAEGNIIELPEEIREKKAKPWRDYPLAWRRTQMQTGLCDVCKVFGSTVFGGKVQVDDLPLAKEFERVLESLVEVRDGVGIDRDAGTAVENLKFNYEVVPSLTAFRFYLTAENLESRDAALLALGLLEMMNGAVPLGGKSTRGLGRGRLHLDSVYHFNFDDESSLPAERLLDYLKPPEQRRPPVADSTALSRAFLETCVRQFLEGGNHA